MKENNEKKVACFGEILWDIFPGNQRRAGGAPFNVAYHLNKMGVGVKMISSVGNDELGRELLDKLKSWNISDKSIQVNKDFPTSTVVAAIDENNEASYQIVENVAWDNIEETETDKEILRNADAMVFGSLSARSANTRNTLFELLEASKYNIFDINLRAPHYDINVIKELLFKTHLVKFNKAELKMMLNFLGKEYKDERSSMLYIQDEFKLNEIIVSNGSKGAFYAGGSEFIKYPAVKVIVNDTVGSGDAFLAGFISKRLVTEDMREAMLQGICMGAFITSKSGACPEYSLEEFENFKKTNI